MQEVYFKQIGEQLKKQLERANKTIHIAMAWFTNHELFQVLENCLNRNLNVELVLLDDPINFMEYAPDFNRFLQLGGHLYIASRQVGFMHHKFCIIDNKLVASGSYNWTYYAENRNIENLFLTDDSTVITGYQQEFQRLVQLLTPALKAPRINISDLETYDQVDFTELNTEIEQICRVQKRPVRQVYTAKTQVQIKQVKCKPIAKYDIAIMTSNDSKNEEAVFFIHAGAALPASKQMTFYFDSLHLTSCPCKIVSCKDSNYFLIKEEDILRVAKGTQNPNLLIQLTMHLDDNGSLKVDILCEESGQRMTISTLNTDLIEFKTTEP